MYCWIFIVTLTTAALVICLSNYVTAILYIQVSGCMVDIGKTGANIISKKDIRCKLPALLVFHMNLYVICKRS